STRVVRAEFTDKSEIDPRRGAHRKVYWVRVKKGEIYHVYMQSTDLTPYLRLETADGKHLTDKGANAHITFNPSEDGDSRLVVSSVERETVGRFRVRVSLQQQIRIGSPPPRLPLRLRRPGLMPGPGLGPPMGGATEPMTGGTEVKAPEVN